MIPPLRVFLVLVGILFIISICLAGCNITPTQPIATDTAVVSYTPRETPTATSTPISSPSVTATIQPPSTPIPSPSLIATRQLPTVIISPILSPTITFLPTLVPATPAENPAVYHLASQTADQADEMITRMEQNVIAYWNAGPEPSNPYPPYRPVWYAAWNALAHFPSDPRAAMWRWKIAYFMALSGEGDEATQIYTDLISNALNQQGLSPQSLPNWFRSGEAEPGYITQPFTLELTPLKVPGNDARYLVTIGRLDGIDVPGGTCLLIVENHEKFTLSTIYNGFPDRGFFVGLRNPIGCDAKDVTDDGVDEIIVDQYTGGHVGTTKISIFNVSETSPQIMPFTSLQEGTISIWGGWIINYIKANEKTQIQIGIPLGFCSEYGISNYEWNGKWFEVVNGRVEFEQSANRNDDALFQCSGRITEYAEGLNTQDAISILDKAFNTYSSSIHDNQEMLEEFRILRGLYSAFAGDQEAARSVFDQIINSPTISDSVWIPPATDFFKAYQSASDLYRACPALNICASYLARYNSDNQCVNVRLCNYDTALQATITTAFSFTPLTQITDKLKSAGVNISTDGWYDFDGDGHDERWFTVTQPGDTDFELWIVSEYSSGIKGLLAGHFTSQHFQFKQTKSDPQKILTDTGFGQTIEIIRRPITGEPFLIVKEMEMVDPVEQDLMNFKELRQKLFMRSAPATIYEALLDIEKRYLGCPFETKGESGEVSNIYDCASFYYTLAFSAELAGKENDAVERYLYVWRVYPDSQFAVLARLKLKAVK